MLDRSALRELLQAHVPVDGEEALHQQRMLALLGEQDGCFARDHFAPGHFTASAFVLSPDQGQLLLIFHSKLTRWLQPGGHLELSDVSIEDAARREVSEEVGLNHLPLVRPGIFDLDAHEIPARKSEPAHEHFDIRFVFVAPSLEFKAGDDALSARWFPLGEVTPDATDRSVARAVEKLRL